MLGIINFLKAWLFVFPLIICLSINTSFVMIDLQERAQGD